MQLGQNFAPLGGDNLQRQPGQGPNGPVSPVQEAIQTLTTRIPRVVGAGAIAPGALLNGPGGSNSVLDALRRLLGGGLGPSPAPSITPGADGRTGPLPPVEGGGSDIWDDENSRPTNGNTGINGGMAGRRPPLVADPAPPDLGPTMPMMRRAEGRSRFMTR